MVENKVRYVVTTIFLMLTVNGRTGHGNYKLPNAYGQWSFRTFSEEDQSVYIDKINCFKYFEILP